MCGAALFRFLLKVVAAVTFRLLPSSVNERRVNQEPSENTFGQISGLSLNEEMKGEPHQSARSEDIWHNLRLPLSLRVLREARKYAVLL